MRSAAFCVAGVAIAITLSASAGRPKEPVPIGGESGTIVFRSRTLLSETRCYLLSDGAYQCWMPEGVCEFVMPKDLKDASVAPSGSKAAATCFKYAELVPITE
jgi:hypothetical protein